MTAKSIALDEIYAACDGQRDEDRRIALQLRADEIESGQTDVAPRFRKRVAALLRDEAKLWN